MPNKKVNHGVEEPAYAKLALALQQIIDYAIWKQCKSFVLA